MTKFTCAFETPHLVFFNDSWLVNESHLGDLFTLCGLQSQLPALSLLHLEHLLVERLLKRKLRLATCTRVPVHA